MSALLSHADPDPEPRPVWRDPKADNVPVHIRDTCRQASTSALETYVLGTHRRPTRVTEAAVDELLARGLLSEPTEDQS